MAAYGINPATWLLLIDQAPGPPTGTLAAVLADATLGAAGAFASTGTLAVSLAGATLAASGSAAVPGGSTAAAAATLGTVTLAASGLASAAGTVVGMLASTTAPVTLAGAGSAAVPGASAGTLATTLAGVTLAAPGSFATAAALAAPLGGVTLAASGVYVAVGATGTLGVALDAATLAAPGIAAVPGASIGVGAAVLVNVTLAGVGSMALPGTGSLAATLGSVTLVVLATAGVGPPLPPTLLAAIHAWLDGSTDFAAAFGSTDQTPKFWTNEAPSATRFPYGIISLMTEDSEYISIDDTGRNPYIDSVSVQCSVFALSATQARTLGKQMIAVLDDAPMYYQEGTLLEFRRSNDFLSVEDPIAPGDARVYHMTILFEAKSQRYL